jgi:hypothetical protein
MYTDPTGRDGVKMYWGRLKCLSYSPIKTRNGVHLENWSIDTSLFSWVSAFNSALFDDRGEEDLSTDKAEVERLREAADEKRTKANKAREDNTHESCI